MRSSLISKGCFIVLLAGMLFPATQAMAESAFVTKGSKAAGMTTCVAPTEVIRRNHMDFLKHERDETVREGIRGMKYSIAECIDCHAGTDESGKPLPVNADGQFCQACHGYVAVSPACFDCHRTTPEKKPARYGYLHPTTPPALPDTQPAGLQRD